MSRALLPHRDTARAAMGIYVAQFIGVGITVAAFYLVPDALVAWMTGGWG